MLLVPIKGLLSWFAKMSDRFYTDFVVLIEGGRLRIV